MRHVKAPQVRLKAALMGSLGLHAAEVSASAGAREGTVTGVRTDHTVEVRQDLLPRIPSGFAVAEGSVFEQREADVFYCRLKICFYGVGHDGFLWGLIDWSTRTANGASDGADSADSVFEVHAIDLLEGRRVWGVVQDASHIFGRRVLHDGRSAGLKVFYDVHIDSY